MIEKNTVSDKEILESANSLRWELGENLHDSLLESIYQDAAKISEKVVTKADEKPRYDWDRTLDR